ncbi:hypothetical protein [Microbulbifer rhizosphaerae]|uniref:Beta-galactosidase n=1 Tax=Microbulbifer rhizosphaerae TaxID=1562603 RepID=A0A7W4WF99_9GAMM|nr:hypothetical protein [Microbulbifer rhizosphaerae]MBB3062722.1 hypothetical protein [Microbulbifer rhizosphaerae]
MPIKPLILFALLLALPGVGFGGEGGKQFDPEVFAFDWEFHRGDLPCRQVEAAAEVRWRKVQIPHDWSIESSTGGSPFFEESGDAYDTGYARAGVGWYRKAFHVPESLFVESPEPRRTGGRWLLARKWGGGSSRKICIGDHRRGSIH